MKKVISLFIITLICVCCFVTPAMAKTDGAQKGEHREYSKKPTEGIESPFSGGGYFILEPSSIDGSILGSDPDGIVISGDTYIGKTSSREIYGYAETVLSDTADTVGYIMRFQIWDGYEWITYTESTKERNDYRSVAGFHYKSAEPGNYYRLKVTFYYEHNGVFDSITGCSHYIEI